MNTRNGKIAHLPRSIRDSLNERLDRSQPAYQILPWLNGFEEVQEIIKEDFDSVLISEQNLSQWRQGGFQEWLVRRELCLEAGDVTELAEGMQEETGQGVLADAVAVVLAARFGTLLAKWDGEVDANFEAKSRALNQICRSVGQLQHGMHRARREAFEYTRQWEQQQKTEKEEMRQQVVQPFMDAAKVPSLASAYGGGKLGRKIAAYVLAVKRGDTDAKLDISPADTFDDEQVKPPRKTRVAKKPRKHTPATKSKPLTHKKMARAPGQSPATPPPTNSKRLKVILCRQNPPSMLPTQSMKSILPSPSVPSVQFLPSPDRQHPRPKHPSPPPFLILILILISQPQQMIFPP